MKKLLALIILVVLGQNLSAQDNLNQFLEFLGDGWKADKVLLESLPKAIKTGSYGATPFAGYHQKAGLNLVQIENDWGSFSLGNKKYDVGKNGQEKDFRALLDLIEAKPEKVGPVTYYSEYLEVNQIYWLAQGTCKIAGKTYGFIMSTYVIDNALNRTRLALCAPEKFDTKTKEAMKELIE